MVALELEDDTDASYTSRVQKTLLRKGFVVAQRPGLDVLRIDPSLTIDLEDIVAFPETLESVLTRKAP